MDQNEYGVDVYKVDDAITANRFETESDVEKAIEFIRSEASHFEEQMEKVRIKISWELDE